MSRVSSLQHRTLYGGAVLTILLMAALASLVIVYQREQEWQPANDSLLAPTSEVAPERANQAEVSVRESTAQRRAVRQSLIVMAQQLQESQDHIESIRQCDQKSDAELWV
jgi:hypothetical protein